MTALTTALATLGDKIINSTNAMFITCVPVLHGGVFDRGIIQNHQFDHSRMQLVGVKHRGCAPLQITYRSSFLGHDQGALKLARVAGVDAEVGGKLHRARHPLGDEHEGAIAEHRRIESREVVVVAGHHRTEITLDQIGVILHGLTDRAEDHAVLGQLLAIGGGDRNAVEHRIHSHVGEALLLT